MKKTYYIWLLIHGVVWTLAIIDMPPGFDERELAGICLFFIILFILPLFTEKPAMQSVLFCIQALTTIIIFYPASNELNPYVLIIHALIIAEAVFYLSALKSLIVIGVQLGSSLWLVMEATLNLSQLPWLALFYLLLVTALLHYQTIHKREKDLRRKNDVLLAEYRKMKRQLVTEEEQVRQDERMLIGHEIHDSVGHKLTALIMQFEAFRVTASEKEQEKISNLKELADQSLEETRTAVKSFKQRKVGGLQGVIRLIRKLELESFMKINFSVKHGAFAAPLTGEESFAVYRAVQEALTNIMKHSSSRKAEVMFESPGGSIFRFEVINFTTLDPYFQEGYGLKAMRERLEKVGGSLEILHGDGQFVVRGSLRLSDRSG